MKKILAVFTTIVVLSFAAMAFAHGTGGSGWGGHMGGPGMMGGGAGGGHMMDYGGHGGYGGGHMGYGDYDKETKEFLDKTSDLRKQLHEKRFAYMEAVRTGEEKTAKKLGKELDELSEKLYAAAPKGRSNARGGNASGRFCW